MKELTIGEKAKAYDEALERAKEIIECSKNSESKEVRMVFSFFPELKESEDERIRTFLHHTFTAQYLCKDKLGKWHGEPVVNILAYLEKQGEQPKKHDVCDYCDQQGRCVSLCPMKLVEKQGEQKPTEWSHIDENRINNICDFIQGHTNFADSAKEAAVVFLKSLKDRVLPQPKQEWSDEDNEHIKSIISTIECSKAQFPNAQAVLEAYNSDLIWLKSLRPQSQWKPSDEQMADLWNMVCECRPADAQLLQDLYFGLKTLRGK